MSASPSKSSAARAIFPSTWSWTSGTKKGGSSRCRDRRNSGLPACQPRLFWLTAIHFLRGPIRLRGCHSVVSFAPLSEDCAMSRLQVVPLLALLGIFAAPLAAHAQVSKQGLLSSEGARRAGLTRMWFTQLEMDSSRGKVQGLTQHVSSVLA